jgi:hypothetical protein
MVPNALRMRASCLLVALTLVAGSGPRAEAAFCKTKGGAVFSRDKCRRKETAVDLAASAGAAKGDAGPPGGSQPRLRAVDAGGRQLPGSFAFDGRFVYRDGTHVFAIVVHPDGLSGIGFYYNGAGCTEDRFVQAGQGDLYASVPVEFAAAYYAGDPVEMRTFLSASYPTTPADCMGAGKTYSATTGFCCYDSPTSAVAGPAVPVDLSAFTPPFRVEVEE